MNEVVKEYSTQSLQTLLAFIPITYVVITLITCFIFIPLKKRSTFKLDERIITALIAIIIGLLTIFLAPDKFQDTEGIISLIIGAILSVFLVRMRLYYFNRKKN